MAEIVSQILKVTITKLLSEIDTACKLKGTLLFKEFLLNLKAIQCNWKNAAPRLDKLPHVNLTFTSNCKNFHTARQTIRTHVIELQHLITYVFLT